MTTIKRSELNKLVEDITKKVLIESKVTITQTQKASHINNFTDKYKVSNGDDLEIYKDRGVKFLQIRNKDKKDVRIMIPRSGKTWRMLYQDYLDKK